MNPRLMLNRNRTCSKGLFRTCLAVTGTVGVLVAVVQQAQPKAILIARETFEHVSNSWIRTWYRYVCFVMSALSWVIQPRVIAVYDKR